MIKEPKNISLWTVKQKPILWYSIKKTVKRKAKHKYDKFEDTRPYKDYGTGLLTFMPRFIVPTGALMIKLKSIRNQHDLDEVEFEKDNLV